MLHVSDDDIVPVGNIESSIGAKLHIRGAEVLVRTLDEILAGLSPHVIFFVLGLEVILFNPKETDCVGEDVIALPLIRKVTTGNHSRSRYRPHFLLHEAMHLEPFALWANLIRAAPGAIVSVMAAPGIKTDSMRIRAVARMHRNSVLPWIEAEHGRGTAVKRRPPWMLMGIMEEDSALPVEGSIRPHRESVGSMVSISRSNPLEQADPHVGHIISVRVLQEQDIRLRGHQDSPIPEFKSRRVMDLGKGDALVGHSIPVFVGEDQKSVVHLLQGLPFGIGRPGGGPEAPLGVYRHLHRVDQFREHFFIREEIDLHILGNRQLGEPLLPGVIAGEVALFSGIRTSALSAHV